VRPRLQHLRNRIVYRGVWAWLFRTPTLDDTLGLSPLARNTSIAVTLVVVAAVLASFFGWDHSAITQYGVLMVGIVGGAIVIWYAKGTQRLREESGKQAQESVRQSRALQAQLTVVQEQRRYSLLPYLVPVVYSRDRLQRWPVSDL
jgi:hypothetical protein